MRVIDTDILWDELKALIPTYIAEAEFVIDNHIKEARLIHNNVSACLIVTDASGTISTFIFDGHADENHPVGATLDQRRDLFNNWLTDHLYQELDSKLHGRYMLELAWTKYYDEKRNLIEVKYK